MVAVCKSKMMALVVGSPVIAIVMMVRMTSLTAWKWIGLKPMVVVVVLLRCTRSLELVLALAIIGVVVQLTILEAPPFT